MTNDEWAEEILERIHMHRRREASGFVLASMMNEGLLDIFDALVVAPLLLDENRREIERIEFARRRQEYLDNIEMEKKEECCG